MKGDQKVALQCLVAAINYEIKKKKQVKPSSLQQLQSPKESNGTNSSEELINVYNFPCEERYFLIGKILPTEDRVKMLLSLVQNLDVFAWSPYEVPSMDLEFIMHKLNVDPLFPPKKQKPRQSTKHHAEVMKEEVEKLKQDGAIKEMFYLDWLANTVVVKKKNRK